MRTLGKPDLDGAGLRRRVHRLHGDPPKSGARVDVLRRQLFANARHHGLARRLTSCVGVRSSWWPKTSVHIHGSYRRGVHLENTAHDKNRRQNPRR